MSRSADFDILWEHVTKQIEQGALFFFFFLSDGIGFLLLPMCISDTLAFHSVLPASTQGIWRTEKCVSMAQTACIPLVCMCCILPWKMRMFQYQ